MRRHSFEPQSPERPPSGPAPVPPPRPLQTRPDPGTLRPGHGGLRLHRALALEQEVLRAAHARGRDPGESRQELAAGLGNAIRSAEEFLKD